jgi:GTP-binding protein EngB required for normal cell division
MPSLNREASKQAPPLNAYQRQTILLGCLDIHHRLTELESILAQSRISSPFSKYVNDISPTEVKVIQDYFARLRITLLDWLREADIPPDVHRSSTRWALQIGMITLNIAVAEMGPERLRGYGPLKEAGREFAMRMRQDLDRLIDRVDAYLRQGLGRDLSQRLAHLDAAHADVATLSVLDQIITRRGLVEFRPQLEQIVRRLESPQFEIAVFGRVSSGKSTLLNHLAGEEVLPVGVTPITAVPSRLTRGERLEAIISFAELQPQTIDVAALREYASEEGNPGNHKHVTSILVRIPSFRLREGVILVDTPGIGSLARSGSAETFAYLPHCDLGVVLIDAATTFNDDDLDLMRLLTEAGVPLQVLLSKADLLIPEQRRQATEYIQKHVEQELGLDVGVHPVSIVGDHEKLLHQWFEQEIKPLLARSCALVEQSLRRKIAHLRESVIATLETAASRQRSGAEADRRAPLEVPQVRQLSGEADRLIHAAHQRCRDWTNEEAALFDRVLDRASQTLVSSSSQSNHTIIANAAGEMLEERGQLARRVLVELQETLRRTLESLRQADPAVQVDISAVRDMTFRGLPPPEIPSLDAASDVVVPWWSAVLPSLAAWSTRRQIVEMVGPELREQVDLRDRQIQAWLKQSLASLTEAYENQAEIFRTRVQRSQGPVTESGADGDARALTEDLRALRQAEIALQGEEASTLEEEGQPSRG